MRRLPESHFEMVGPEIVRSLRNRRDTLLEFARDFYLFNAGWVEIHATDEKEIAVVERLPDDNLRVSIFHRGDDGEGGNLYFERVFLGNETRGGCGSSFRGDDDVARVTGEECGSILVTLIGGGGDDTLSVASSRVREGASGSSTTRGARPVRTRNDHENRRILLFGPTRQR